jgi:predicted HTH domain antitoxin
MENEPLETLTVSVPEALMKEIAPDRGELAELLRLGLRQVKMEQALALYKQGGISIWRAARLAGVSLREMTQYAAAQGLRAILDDETLREELA